MAIMRLGGCELLRGLEFFRIWQKARPKAFSNHEKIEMKARKKERKKVKRLEIVVWAIYSTYCYIEATSEYTTYWPFPQ